MTCVTIPYKPRYPELHAALESRRFSVLVAHRRFGKTVLAVNHLLKQAAVCRRERGSFAYVAPFRNQAKAVAWDYLKHYSAPVPGRAVHEGELSVLLPNGAKLRIFGADNPDALRGLYFDGVVLDEVAQMKPEVWEEIVRPALSDRMGWALFIGTPKGVNLFSDLYYKAAELQAEGDPDWYAASFPVTATSALPPSDVENMRRELSDNAWRQEMLCDFTASSDDTLIGLDDVTEAMSRRASEVDRGNAGNLGRGRGSLRLGFVRGLSAAGLADVPPHGVSQHRQYGVGRPHSGGNRSLQAPCRVRRCRAGTGRHRPSAAAWSPDNRGAVRGRGFAGQALCQSPGRDVVRRARVAEKRRQTGGR